MTLSGWHTPLRYLKGVGPARSRYLAKMGLVTAEDLLFHLPFRYEDRSKSCEIARLDDPLTVHRDDDVAAAEPDITGVRPSIDVEYDDALVGTLQLQFVG